MLKTTERLVGSRFWYWAISMVAGATMLSASVLADTFANKVEDIEAKQYTSINELFLDNNFISIWNNADAYYNDAETYLEESNNNDIKKRIAIISMQNLSSKQFVMLCYFAINLTNKNKLSKELLNELVFRNARVVDRENSEFTKLLIDLKKTGFVKENYIDSVLSGAESTKRRVSGCCSGPWPMR